MSRLVQIKVCGLTREADVDLALSLGADFCGFIVYPKSPRGLSYERAAELAARVPEGKRVVVDVETGQGELRQLSDAGFDYFQIHARGELEFSKLAAQSALVGKERLWSVPRVAPGGVFPKSALEYADTILVDTFAKNQIGGTGKVGDWARFSKLQKAFPHTRWVLAGGLSSENVQEALASTGANHLDISSGIESAPGIKDHEKLRKVFQTLRE